MATKAPPRSASTPTELKPLVPEFYDVSEAAVRLGLREPGASGQAGEKWLRDGFNRPLDGSKGKPFPGRYLAGKLKFTEADLAQIAQIALEESEARRNKPRPSTGRPRRRSAKALAA